MLLAIITQREACISKLSPCCTDETSLGFHVSRLDGVLNLQGGFQDTCVAG